MLNFNGSLRNNSRQQIDVKINVLRFKESGSYILYAPALEIYGYGKTVQMAKDSFGVYLEEFFNYTITKSTLFKELRRMGWKISKKKKKVSYASPAFTDLLQSNETLVDIINNQNYQNYNVSIPMAVQVQA